MTRREIDLEILKLASLMQMVVNINKILETTKDPKQIDDFNTEFRLRYRQLQTKCIELNEVLDNYFKYEKENNNVIDFNLMSVKKQISQFL